MKNTFYLFAAVFITAFLFSCSGTGSIDSTASIEKIHQLLKEKMPADAAIFRITLSGSTEDADLSIVEVYYHDPALKDEVKHKYINLLNESMSLDDTKPMMFVTPSSVWSEHTEDPVKYTKKLDEFSWKDVPTQVEKAQKMLPAGYTYFGIENYDMVAVADDPIAITINATDDKVDKEYTNRSVTTYYYQFEALIKNDGSMTLKAKE
jgi:hypothetical protein